MIRHLFRPGALLCALVLIAGCGKKNVTPSNVANPDRFLYERGQAELKEKKWIAARDHFRQVFDNYPQSPLRPDAKLAIGDTYLGEKSAESLVLAETEYREFLTFYPTHPRADYAQFKLAMTFFSQMKSPDRDQTNTKEALEEFQVLFDRYPNSPLIPEARMHWREAQDRLSDHNFGVGLLYYRLRVYAGAVSRFQEILTSDPNYTRRDAVYYYLAEVYLKTDTKEGKARALPYYDRLVKEFTQSEYLERAQERLKELQTQ